MMKTAKMLRWSLRLDLILLFKIRDISVAGKIYFIVLKYLLYLKNTLFGLSDAPCSATVFSKKYYYNDVYGLASLQRVYCEHYRLKQIIKNDSVIIDVGAHIGQFAFFCRHYLRAKRVVSIEPVKESFTVLRLNAGDPEDCAQAAVSNETKIVTMHVSKTSSQLSTYVKDTNDSYVASFDIQAEKLDDVVKRYDIETADLLKIDTEGSEYDVLRSGAQLLSKVNVLLVEMSVFRASLGNIFKVGAFVEEKGFKLVEFNLYENHYPVTVDGIFRNSHAC